MTIHLLLLPILLTLIFSLTQAATDTTPNPTKCKADNCARAVSGTRSGSDHLKTASADCSSALVITDYSFLATVTSWITWVEETDTVTVTATPTPTPTPVTGGERKRQIDILSIPPYASPCLDYFAYSSACSCLGITAYVVTETSSTETIYWWDFITSTTTVTVPAYTTTTTSSTAPPSPTCTADILTDPLNCGSCGTVCPTGICENGSCTSTQCKAQSCGSITTCSTSATCFCFASTSSTSTINTGFCGSNGVCSELTPCATDDDCTAGSICAIKTCCAEPSVELPGVCLVGVCAAGGNDGLFVGGGGKGAAAREWEMMMMMMAGRVGGRRRGLTAAY